MSDVPPRIAGQVVAAKRYYVTHCGLSHDEAAEVGAVLVEMWRRGLGTPKLNYYGLATILSAYGESLIGQREDRDA